MRHGYCSTHLSWIDAAKHEGGAATPIKINQISIKFEHLNILEYIIERRQSERVQSLIKW